MGRGACKVSLVVSVRFPEQSTSIGTIGTTVSYHEASVCKNTHNDITEHLRNLNDTNETK